MHAKIEWFAAAVAAAAIASMSAIAAPAPTQPALRCGWFENPTPGNAWLTDRDAQWVVGIQGGHQADGDWPTFPESEWVGTNRSYGYGCTCLKVVADPESKEIKQILSVKPRPLEACRDDPALKEPVDEAARASQGQPSDKANQ